MHYLLRATVVILALLSIPAVSDADDPAALKGIALVIGQSKYDHLGPLPNPGSDARAIQKLLGDLGFEVRSVSDRNHEKLERDLERFIEDADDADVALLYYAGHGIEAGGENYLLPTDTDTASLLNARKALVPLTPILERLRLASPLSIILLDACRTSPFLPAQTAIKAAPDAKPSEIRRTGLAISRSIAVVEIRQMRRKARPLSVLQPRQVSRPSIVQERRTRHMQPR